MPLIGLVVAVLAFCCGGFLAARRSPDARRFAAVCLLAGGYVLALSGLYLTGRMAFSHAAISVGALLMIAILRFAFRFARTGNSLEAVAFVPMAVVAATAPTGAYVAGLSLEGGVPVPVNGPLMPALALLVVLHCGLVWTLLWRAARQAPGQQRTQAWLVFAALTLLLASILACNVVGPAFGFVHANLVTAASLLAFLACVAYALSARRLFDVQAVIFSGSALLLTPILTLAGILGSLALRPDADAAVVSAGALAGVIAGELIRGRAAEALRRALYPGTASEDRAIEIAVSMLGTVTDAESFDRSAAALLRAVFGAGELDSRAWDERDQLQYDPAVLQVPVARTRTYRLAAREDSQPYTARDMSLAQLVLPALESALERSVRHEHAQRLQRDGERQLAADIAHGLQTPLAELRAQLEQASPDDPHIRLVDGLSARLRALLLFSDGQADARTSGRLDAIAEEAVRAASGRAAAAGVRLATDLRPAPAILVPRLCASMAEELIGNAIANAGARASAAAEAGTVFISTAWGLHGSSLTVADTGPDADVPALQLLADDPWRRTGARAGQGMGLGIAIAAEAARACGGTLRFSRRDGGGVTATVSLPAPAELVH